MTVRLNITMQRELYLRLKRELPARAISAFISKAVRARLRPDRKTLDAAYKAATQERARLELARDWQPTETDGWPE